MPERGADLAAHVDERVRQPALALVEGGGEDLRVGRVGHGLADPEEQPKNEQAGETSGEARRGRGDRPHEEAGRHDPIHVVPVDQPSRHQLEQGVGPEKCEKRTPTQDTAAERPSSSFRSGAATERFERST